MQTGLVSDFDTTGLFGVIDADDGRHLLFNLTAAPSGLRHRFRIGMRVTFELETAHGDWPVTPASLREADPCACSTGKLQCHRRTALEGFQHRVGGGKDDGR
jgi:cold shock CspA family protein